MNREEVYF